jgi:DNA-binding CsgD family transcriptional regulator
VGTELRNRVHARGWPVQPGAGQLDVLVERLSAPATPVVQVLRGGAGSGKTTLIGEVAVRLQARGFSVLRAAGRALLRDVPLAVFAPLLAQLPRRSARVEDQVALLVARILPDASRHVLLVDDAHQLDGVSVGVMVQLVDAGVRCLLATPPMPDFASSQSVTRPAVSELMTIWQGRDRLEYRQIAPLTEADAARLVSEYTGGLVDGPACDLVVARAAGNPLFLRELTRAAVSGDLKPAPGVPTLLAGLIAHRWAGLGEDVLALAQTVALAGRWPLELCPSRVAVDQLISSEVLQRRGGWLLATHPLVADVLSTSMTGTEQATRCRDAARDLEAVAPADAWHRFMAIVLRHRAGDRLPATELLRTGWHARHAGDHQLAENLAGSALALAGPHPPKADRDNAARDGSGENDGMTAFDGLLLRAAARSSMGRLELAEQDFAAVKALAVTGVQLARYASAVGWHLAMRRHDHDRAIELGMLILAERAAPRDADEPELAALRADIGQWQITRLMQDQDHRPSIRFRLPDPDVSVVAVAGAGSGLEEVLTRVAVAAYGADLVGLRSALAEAETMTGTSVQAGHGPELIALGRLYELVLAGHCEAALTQARQRRQATPTPGPAVGTWAFVEALLAAHGGYPIAALEAAEQAVALLSADDLTGTLGPATAVHAALLAREGRQDSARRVAAGIVPDPRTDDKTAVFLAEARAWQHRHLRAAGFDGAEPHGTATDSSSMGPAGEGAGQVLAPAVAAADRAGKRTYAIFAAHLAVCLGAADSVLDHLRQLVVTVPGPLVAAVLAHAEAAAAGNVRLLLEAATGLEAAGLHGGAIDAAQQAARSSRGPQRREELSQAAALIARCRARGAMPTVPGQETGLIGLTGRELLVAHATVQLGASRAVAAELGVSVRTVDNQLRVIYRKLGIAGRDQLAAALHLAAGRQHL